MHATHLKARNWARSLALRSRFATGGVASASPSDALAAAGADEGQRRHGDDEFHGVSTIFVASRASNRR